MQFFSTIFIFELLLASVFAGLTVWCALCLLNRMLCRQRRIFRLSALRKKGGMIAFAFITISIFSIVAHYLEKDAKKTFMGVHNVLSAADSMSVTYQHHNLNLYDIYFVRDKELYEKIKSLIITPEYKLRALWFGGFRESMYFNVGNREHKKLGSTFFDICPEAGLELYGDTFFLRFEAADKHLFSKIHKTLKQSGCLLPPMPRKNSRREPNDPQ